MTAITFTPNLALNEPPYNSPLSGSGDPVWSTNLNYNATILDQMYGNTTNIAVSTSGTTAFTAIPAPSATAAGGTSQAMRILLAGALAANQNVLLPYNVAGMWVITNSCTGAFTVTLGSSNLAGTAFDGTTVVCPSASSIIVYCDGNDVKKADDGVNSATLTVTGNTYLATTSGSVGIGTTSPAGPLEVKAATSQIIATSTTGTNSAKLTANNTGGSFQFAIDNSTGGIYGGSTPVVAYTRAIWNNSATAPTIFYTNSAERMRIGGGTGSNDGNVYIGQTSYDPIGARTNGTVIGPNTVTGSGMQIRAEAGGIKFGINVNSGTNIVFYSDTGSAYTSAGNISTTGGNTYFNTPSDYRLKENVQPMSNGLATITALKPITYDWTRDKSASEGFIAHELQAVIPLAVYGEKDATNEDGSIHAQQVDYSKIVVHLVAAIQELKAEFDAYKLTHP
jgi:hypothetical protein